ncbi:hypothetical protein [Sphingomonas astaxanthinifaciens]|uniref:Uncharacterized protein n=1 Tax=Sphingomonas astaxanthinifaciens DSM 22298 TaxID=1123267 RepID=A0ABQ5Z9F9_9SPHN|nr:hypothetical protein [Sphingomonas astaxanthinifaciens]GLR48106.1 hypothetical protein GCM10007925_18190 [Sphingomonas astaxanthinifaciens DSM 22298]
MGTLTNIEVHEVIYTHSQLGSDKVAKGSFGSTSAWSATGGCSLSGVTAVGVSASDRLSQTGVFVNGETYRLVMKIKAISANKIRVTSKASNTLLVSVGFVDDVSVQKVL